MISEQKDIGLDPELEDRIAAWLSTEILNTLSARKGMEEEWEDIMEEYESIELEGKQDFPFENAACLVIPIIPMMIETMKAKIFTTIFAPKDPLTVKTRREDLREFVASARAFLTWACAHELKLRDRLDTILSECLKLGTAVGKAVYSKEVRRQKIWDEAGQRWAETAYVIRDNPEIIHPPLANIVFPLEVKDDTLDEAPWIAEKFTVTRNQLKRWKAERKYPAEKLDMLLKWDGVQSNKTKVEEFQERQDGKPQHPKVVDLYEVWFDHVISDDEQEMYKLVGYLHLETQTFLRVTHSWFPYGLHPYEILPHEKREHRVYGIGVGKIGLPFQREISTQHNQRLDAMTIANANAFKKKADSLIPEDIRIRPGATIPVDDMDDLQPLFTGQKYDSTIQEEQNTLALVRERVGLQEYSPDVLANAQTTSLTLAMGESTRRFDQTVNRVRNFISRLTMKLLLLYQKYYPEGRPYNVMGEDGQFVGAMLQFPSDFIYNSVLVEVTATTSVTSAELERQNKLALFNMITQAHGQISQYAMAAESQESPIGMRLASLVAVEGISTYVIDVIQDYNLSQLGELVAGLKQVKQLASLQKSQLMAQLSGGEPGMGGVPGIGGAPVPTEQAPIG